MECPYLETVISEYVDDQLPPQEHQQITDHLRHCRECHDSYRRVQKLEQKLAASQRDKSATEVLAQLYPQNDVVLVDNQLQARRHGRLAIAAEDIAIDTELPRPSAGQRRLELRGNTIISDEQATIAIAAGSVQIGGQPTTPARSFADIATPVPVKQSRRWLWLLWVLAMVGAALVCYVGYGLR